MDLYNFGALIVTAIYLVIFLILGHYEISPGSPAGLIFMGTVVIFTSLILEIKQFRPRLLYAPLWILGFLPFGYGLFLQGGIVLSILVLPVFITCLNRINKNKIDKVHHAVDVTHKYTEKDPDMLRNEINYNRKRKEESRFKKK